VLFQLWQRQAEKAYCSITKLRLLSVLSLTARTSRQLASLFAMAVPKPRHHDFAGRDSSPTDMAIAVDYKSSDGTPGLQASPGRPPRSSFSSIREQESDLTQTFTSSRVTSYIAQEEVVDDVTINTGDSHEQLNMSAVILSPPLTRPHSRLHGNWILAVPANTLGGWKQIDMRGRIASKSFSDIPALAPVWTTLRHECEKSKEVLLPHDSRLERLPQELLGTSRSFFNPVHPH
jgi:hypothetical protein